MTIPAGELSVTHHTGNDTADTFDYEFKITNQSDLKVTQTDLSGVDSVLLLTTDYTVTGVGDDGGGSITLVAGALASGYLLAIEDDVEVSQLTPYGNQSAFYGNLHEDSYDKNMRIGRKILGYFSRALQIPISVQGVSTDIPKPVSLNLVRWNEAADAMENVTPDAIATSVAFSNFHADTFTDGVDFTASTTTQLTLSSAPGALANTWVYFDGVYQEKSGYSLSSVTITFIVAIPIGVSVVEIMHGTAAVQGTIESSAVTYDNVASGLTANDAKAALDELAARVIESSAVTYDNTASGLTATDAKAALDELESEKANKASPAFTGTVSFSKGADLTTSDVAANILTVGGDGNYFDFTGTDTINGLATVGVGTSIKIHFDAAATLTYNATDLILPGAADITTTAGDEVELVEYATGDWRCVNYTKISGLPVIDFAEEFVTTSSTVTVSAGITTAHILLAGGGGGGGGGGDGGSGNGSGGSNGTASTVAHGTTTILAAGGLGGNPGLSVGSGSATGLPSGSSTILGTAMAATSGGAENGKAGDGNGSTPNPASGGDGGAGIYGHGGLGSTSSNNVPGIRGGGGAGGNGADGAGAGGGSSCAYIRSTIAVTAGDSLVVTIGAGGGGGGSHPNGGDGGSGGDGFCLITWEA